MMTQIPNPAVRRASAAEKRAARELLTDHGLCVDDWAAFDAAMDDPGQRSRTREARKAEREIAAQLCAGCPVKAMCLVIAVREREQYSVRGGLPAWRVSQLTKSVRKGAVQPLISELATLDADDMTPTRHVAPVLAVAA